jgi:hypothetical protein
MGTELAMYLVPKLRRCFSAEAFYMTAHDDAVAKLAKSFSKTS